MQLFSRNKALIAASLVAMGGLAACGDDVTVPVAPEPQPDPVVVTMTPPNATLNIGESFDFAVAITGGNPTPTLQSCTSSSSTIATAAVRGNACRVSAQAPGNVSVLATASNGQTASASVSVNALPAAAAGMTITPNTVALARGQTSTVAASLAGGRPGATLGGLSQASSNSSVATATISGNNITISGVAPGTATITVTGTASGAGSSNATVSAQIGVVVSEAAAAISSLNVTPTTMPLALAATGQITATVQQPAGAPAATVTYTPSAGGIVSVNASGLVTALQPGIATVTVTATAPQSATFAAATLSQQVAITVSPAATVTIASVTQGPTRSDTRNSLPVPANDGIVFSANTQVNQPVDQASVRDQIQVNINLATNGQAVSSVRAYVCDQAGANCELAAEQSFANNQANSSTVQLLVNTADFTANFTNGTSTIKYGNGIKTIKASVRLPNGTENFAAVNNQYILNFDNIDGWAVQFGVPSRTATRNGPPAGTNWNYWGGPDAAGASTIRPVPVFYSGRQVQRVDIGLSNCGGVRTFNATSGFATTYGKGSAYDVNCNGYEHPQSTASDFPRVSNTQDNFNNPGPTVAFAAGYRISAAVPGVTPIRLDYEGPDTEFPEIRRDLPAITGWINDGYSFAANTGASDDYGVGVKPNSRSWFYSGCGNTSVAFNGTSTPIAPCSTDFTGGWNGSNTVGPYTVAYNELDLLDNASSSSNSWNFGVDKQAPLARWSSTAAPGSSAFTTVADTTTYTAAPTNILQGEFIDERAGFIDAAGTDVGAPTLSGGTVPASARSQHHGLSALGGWFPGKMTCLVGAAGNPFTPITAPNCSMVTTAVPNLATQLVDGYRPGFLLNVATLAAVTSPPLNPAPISGVYGYRSVIYDRAGNISAQLTRRFAIDLTQGRTTGLQIPAGIANAGNQFLATYQDSVEIRSYTVSLKYPSLGADTLFFPQTLIDARFNDVANTPASTVLGFPSTMPTMYTSVEVTDGAGAVQTKAAAIAGQPAPWDQINTYGKVNALGVTTWDVANRASAYTPAFVATDTNLVAAILETSVPQHSFFEDMLTGNLAITEWVVLPSTIAAFNAPAGLKARAASSTESLNPPFQRVDFYRRAAGARYEYLGSATAAASADAGLTRYWTWTITCANSGFARLTNNLSTSQGCGTTIAVSDYIAIGVRNNGTSTYGLRTPAQTGIPTGTLP